MQKKKNFENSSKFKRDLIGVAFMKNIKDKQKNCCLVGIHTNQLSNFDRHKGIGNEEYVVAVEEDVLDMLEKGYAKFTCVIQTSIDLELAEIVQTMRDKGYPITIECAVAKNCQCDKDDAYYKYVLKNADEISYLDKNILYIEKGENHFNVHLVQNSNIIVIMGGIATNNVDSSARAEIASAVRRTFNSRYVTEETKILFYDMDGVGITREDLVALKQGYEQKEYDDEGFSIITCKNGKTFKIGLTVY